MDAVAASLNTLDRYLLREWLRILLLAELGFPLVVIVIDVTDKLGSYLARGLSRGALALSYVYYLPEIMFLVLPAAVLFATVFTIGPLGQHSELTAAKASGVSFHRLVRPLFIAAAVTVLFGIVIGDVAPVAVRTLDTGAGQMQDALLEREGRGPDYPTIEVAAAQATYRPKGPKRGWTLRRGVVRYLLGPMEETAFGFDSLVVRDLKERPIDLLAEPKAPEEMRYAELGRYINALARSGSDTKKLRVERALKLAVPFTCLVVAVFGAPLAISGPRAGTAWGVAVSLATTFVFLLLVQLTRAIGSGGVLPPVVAAWLPNLLFGGAAVWMLRKART